MIRFLLTTWRDWRADRALGRWLREAIAQEEEYPSGSGPYGF